ncbi:MAG: hypothetical protein PHN56_03890 [Candidatus Nanoarchaeia archaeon]|nr:hypothetical protein [Candidatus Nanoarchaeia archaeon]
MESLSELENTLKLINIKEAKIFNLETGTFIQSNKNSEKNADYNLCECHCDCYYECHCDNPKMDDDLYTK